MKEQDLIARLQANDYFFQPVTQSPTPLPRRKQTYTLSTVDRIDLSATMDQQDETSNLTSSSACTKSSTRFSPTTDDQVTYSNEFGVKKIEPEFRKRLDMILGSQIRSEEYAYEARLTKSQRVESRMLNTTVSSGSFRMSRPNVAPPPPPPPLPSKASMLGILPNTYAFLNSNAQLSAFNFSNSSTLSITSPRLFSTPCHAKQPHHKIGFECLDDDIRLEKDILLATNNSKQINKEENGISLRFKKLVKVTELTLLPKLKRFGSKFWNIMLTRLFVMTLFLICMAFICSFQLKVHTYYQKFLLDISNSSTLSQEDQEYLNAGSNLIQQTVLLCNGPYFSYQINNLMVLPFSILLLILFNFMDNKNNGRGYRRRPSYSNAVSPFQRKNRFFIAALFCILANEIFKMLESSMFHHQSATQSFNSTAQLFDSILDLNLTQFKAFNNQTNSNQSSIPADFLKIGLGIEPPSLRLFKSTSTIIPQRKITSKPIYMLMPSVLSYSKPRLRPRLNRIDFETTTTRPLTTTTSQIRTTSMDVSMISSANQKLNKVLDSNITEKIGQTANKSVNVIDSFNKTLTNSSQMTLFELSMSLYQNEYVQDRLKQIFASNGTLFDRRLIEEKLRTLGIVLAEVLVIGIRYYPLIGILENDSILCLFFGCVYIWLDLLYNVALVGLCEGLRLNVSFDLLRGLRRVFGVGFFIDLKESLSKFGAGGLMTDHSLPMDARLLFSLGRIAYSLIKSLPHFYCLSYVVVRLTSRLIAKLKKRIFHNKKDSLLEVSYYKSQSSYQYSMVYQTNPDWRLPSIESLTFEDYYVKRLLAGNKNEPSTSQTSISWIWDPNFRFSTRIVCTYTVCFTVLYYLTCFLIFYGFIFIDLIYLPCIYKYAVSISVGMASIICFLQLLFSMRQFKYHLEMFYKGKKSCLIEEKDCFSKRKLATSSFNYAGHAVTYTCWGYLLLFLVFTVISFQIATLVAFSGSSVALLFLIVICPFLVTLLCMKLLNRLLNSLAANFCFLQRKSKMMALKNMKLYGLFLYFKFFYDCFTGIAFCLLRMLRSLLLCLLFMPRLDYSFMGRSLARLDTAFMSYVGYLHLESHHTNPVLVCFCQSLKKSSQLRSQLSKESRETVLRKNRIRSRWFILVLLTKNPSLVRHRRY